MNEYENKAFYPKLLIFSRLRLLLWSTMGIIGIAIAVFVFHSISMGAHWGTLTIPILAVGAFLMLFPKTEKWEYKAWQSMPQQYERHFTD